MDRDRISDAIELCISQEEEAIITRLEEIWQVCAVAGCEEVIKKDTGEVYCKECLKALRTEVKK